MDQTERYFPINTLAPMDEERITVFFKKYAGSKSDGFVVVDNGNIASEALHNALGNGGFAGACAPCDAYGQNVAHKSSLHSFYPNFISYHRNC